MAQPFNILIVGQAGRLEAEAVLFAASLRAADPGFAGRLVVAEPQPGPLWPADPRMDEDTRALLADLGAEVLPFESRRFGAAYPNGNKAEGLAALPAGEPFVFFDTDTLVTGPLSGVPFDFARPAASMARTNTWPVIELYGPGYTATWRALYDRFGLDFASSLDLSHPDEYWQRYLDFNAGWFFGPCPADFGRRLTDTMVAIRDDPPEALVCQPLYPWLDQIALPLVIHGMGGGRPGPGLSGLDGEVTVHYRALPLLYATASEDRLAVLEEIAGRNRVKKALRRHDAFRRTLYQGKGRKARELFAAEGPPRTSQALQNRLKRAKLWFR
ncbi:MAG: hypothetical protein MUF63_03070 [Rhodobacteraceae bacterium]|nr:hypothetical protein [Paracoccaceae bacterium]